jgi:Carboxypeptidase regulatory-like domain
MSRIVGRMAVAVALVSMSGALALASPAVTMAETTGSISGTVTDATTKAPVAGVEVCAFYIAGGCASTNSSGEYTISQLPTGEYKLRFTTDGRNYAPQYYNGKTNESEANPVSVTAGSTTSGIDAALRPGGQITGRVTDASTGAPLPGILVSVYGSSDYVWTNHNGEYAAVGLASGEYKVEFGPPSENQSYFHQYYNDKANESEANPVSVTAGATTSGIDAALQPHVGVTAETGAASAITQTTATLNATVNPHGLFGVYCVFEYGTTTAYGSFAWCSSLPGSGESPVAVSAPVTGLNANTTYHFRIVSSGAYCCHDAEGSDQTFKTRAHAPKHHVIHKDPRT